MHIATSLSLFLAHIFLPVSLVDGILNISPTHTVSIK
jgi:hypothetical protein